MSEQPETTQLDESAAVDGTAVADEAQTGTVDAGAGNGDDYQPAAFQNLDGEPGAGSGGEASLDVILDIPVTLSMEVGRTRITVSELLQLAQGSVVELDRTAGEPLDVLVNGTLVARGEVVVVNDRFGIRLNDVVSPAERVRKLK
jgi:flagellar motor switch protein FliN/FliY